MIRSFARARSSSRRAPPKAASKPCSAIASSSVVVCRRLRDARGPVSSTTRPASIESCTLATISRSPSSATRRSRNSMTSGKLWPVSTCMSGKGKRAGRKAFSARRSSTMESLPPLKSRTGRSSSAATSRMTWMASASRICRWVSSFDFMPRAARTRPFGARPAALAAAAGLGARRAADRGVALVVQRVVGQVALVDARPEVALGPVGERVVLPHRALVVELDELRVGARGGLLAADAGDPRVGAGQRALERGDLSVAAAVRGPGPRQARVGASSTSTCTPKRSSKARHVCSVSGNSTPVSIVTTRVCGAEREQLVEDDRLLLLERAQQDEPLVLGGLGRVSVRPRTRPRRAGPRRAPCGPVDERAHRVRGRTRPASRGRAPASSNVLAPTRAAKALNSSPSSRSASYRRIQRSTASGTRLAGRRTFRRWP